MQEKNLINYEEITKILNQIEELSETAASSLTNIDKLINETINSGVGIWDGESASIFKNKWDDLSSNIPSYIKDIQKQSNNLKIMIDKTKKSD